MIACCTGAHLKDAVLTCRKAGGESGVDFFKITLTDVIVSSVSPAGSNGGDTPIEAFPWLSPSTRSSSRNKTTRAPKGGPVIAGFNVQKNAKTARRLAGEVFRPRKRDAAPECFTKALLALHPLTRKVRHPAFRCGMLRAARAGGRLAASLRACRTTKSIAAGALFRSGRWSHPPLNG